MALSSIAVLSAHLAGGFNELGFVLVVILLSGLWVLVGLAYSMILLALCSQRGTRGSNRYGPEPRMRD